MNTDFGVLGTILILSAVLWTAWALPRNHQRRQDIPVEPINLNQYAIGIDAGSKGTRIYLYNYTYTFDPATSKKNLAMNQLLFCRLTDNSGLGSYTFDNIERAGLDLDECLDLADALVPAEKRNTTYIALGATAGMRLLELKNKPLSDRVIGEIRAHLKTKGYFYNDQANRDPVRILSGSEEGLYAWAASNYLENQLTKTNEDVHGIFDLGGSSAQISFSVPDGLSSTNDLILQKEFNSNPYNLYSQSLLCYGTAAALNLYKTYLLRNKNYEGSPKAHCMPEGYDLEMSGQEMLDSPCTNGAIFDESHAFIPEKSKIKADETYFFIGASNNKNKCPEQISMIFPQTLEKSPFMTDSELSLSTPGKSFFALGNYFEAFDYTRALFGLQAYKDLNDFRDLTLQICNSKYSDLLALRKKNNADISKKRTGLLCMENTFVLQLLEHYGIKDLNQLTPIEYYGENLVNWVLGFLIDELTDYFG